MTRRQRQRTWIAGGIGLIVCGVAGILPPTLNSGSGTAAVSVTVDVIYAASMVLFAVGLSSEASIVARKPLGMTALVIVGLWPVTLFVLNRFAAEEPVAAAGGSIIGYLALLVPACAGLVAGMQVVRAKVVENPWRWAPLWALSGYAGAWVITQLIIVSQPSGEVQSFSPLLQLLATLAGFAGTAGLGILAIVLAAKQRPATTEIYSSSSE